MGGEAGFAAEEAGELAGVAVFDYDDLPGLGKELGYAIGVEGRNPLDGELVGGYAALGQQTDGFFDGAVGGAPAYQGDGGVLGAL